MLIYFEEPQNAQIRLPLEKEMIRKKLDDQDMLHSHSLSTLRNQDMYEYSNRLTINVDLSADRIHRDNLSNNERGGATVYSLHRFRLINFLSLLVLLIFCRIGR